MKHPNNPHLRDKPLKDPHTLWMLKATPIFPILAAKSNNARRFVQFASKHGKNSVACTRLSILLLRKLCNKMAADFHSKLGRKLLKFFIEE